VSTSNPVIDAGELTDKIVRGLIAAELANWASDGTTSLNDPKEPRDGDGAPFVMTSYPDGSTVSYPHVITEEASISSQSFDNRHDLHVADVSLTVSVGARTSTEKFNIKDGVIGFATKNQEDVLRDGGFADGTIEGTTGADWEEDPEIHSWQVTLNGDVYIA